MPLRIDLSADTERGPGYGILRIQGLPSGEGPITAVIQRNQGTEPFLGGGGVWETQSIAHELPPPSVDADGALVFGLDYDLVDPLALLPRNTKVMMTLTTPTAKDMGVVTMRQLFPSLASGNGAPVGSQVISHELRAPVAESAPEPEPELPPVHEERIEPTLDAPPPPPEAPVIVTADDRPLDLGRSGFEDQPEHRSSRLWLVLLIVGAVLLILGGAAFAVWRLGLFESLLSSSPASAVPEVVQGKPEGAKPIETREDLAAYLATSPAGADAYATGKALAEKGKLDFAMLVFQHASRVGSAEAALALAHMYDPDTWSKETSPMPQPDAETAAYWYEPAAAAGNAEAQRQLGKILLSLSPSGPQHDKALEWLNKAVAAGDTKAKELLDAAQK